MRGSIVKRGEGRYSIVFRATDPATGRTRQVWKAGYRTKRAAEDALKGEVQRVDEGMWTPPTKQTVAEFIEGEWLPSLDTAAAGGKMKATTVEFYRRLANRHLVPRIGSIQLRALSTETLERLYRDLLQSGGPKGRALSNTTVHAVHVTIGRVLPRRPASGEGVAQRGP